MTRTEFLNKVVAPSGRFCIFLTRDKSHHFYNSPQEADEFIEQCVNEGADVYFGVSTFNEDVRKSEHSAYLKSFFLDLDCGRDKVYDKDGNLLPKPKGYVDQTTALAALRGFVKAHSLPKPMVVNSGRGVHAYWVLDNPIPHGEWKPIAVGFKKLCFEAGLIIDAAVPADAARILRPIGTKNFKDPENPLDVELWMDAPVIALDDFRRHVPVYHEPPKLDRSKLDATTRALLGNKISKFKNIHIKTIEGRGCEQLKAVLENPGAVDEPMWRAMLSIAWTCEDREKAIHVVSRGHDGYDPLKTIQKAEQTQGPYLCATIETLNPTGCAKCQHKGKIASPIRLGDEVQVATPEQSLFEVVEETAEGVSQVVTHQIPEYPSPYVRGINGGVYRRIVVDGAVEDTMIYRYDFYITKRLTDPERGESVMAMVHMPKDGIRSFVIPLSDVAAQDRLRDALSMHGVIVASAKEWGEIMKYVTMWTNVLQSESEAEVSRAQFGWAEDGCFVIGDRELRDGNRIRYSPPSSATMGVAPLLQKKGTIREWKSVVDMYARPGNEVRAFALFMGFGAPLIRLTPLKGALLNLMSPESGTGKSTIQMAINSIYGKPYDLLLQKTDTINARMHRIGIMNNLPVTIDEITNMAPEQMSELAYAITQGRGKERMKSQGNELRVNNTRWQTIVVSSGNSSIYDKLAALKESPDGEIMRVMEFKVEADTSLTKEESDAIFGKLNDNYGVAGDAYISYLLDNPEAVEALMTKVQAKVDKELGFTSRERFWSAMVTCALVGGIVSNNIQLHGIDPLKILSWLKTAVNPMRAETVVTKSDPLNDMGKFLNEHVRHTLVVNGKPSASGLPMAPLREPYGELVVRWEPDTQCVYISTSHVRKWCAERQVSYKGLVDDLEARGICKRGEKKRMVSGTNLPGTTINVLKIDAAKGGFHVDAAPTGAEPDDA